ncbi:MAG: four helix bundle protein [Saprospiraceae bacterium]|nr:four helix bundle protein [Pyrinomonadaceae bacterium]
MYKQIGFRGLGDTKNQLERAALSISNNIAEGFERGTTTELIHFLYIAKGSCGETRSMLCLCERVPRFIDLKFEISDLRSRSENISKQLHGWIESLKNTDIKGVNFLTDKTRKSFKRKREMDEFDLEMKKYKDELEQQLLERERQAGEDIKNQES